MKKNLIQFSIGIIAIFYSQPLEAQILDYNNKVSVNLRDGTNLILFGKANTLERGSQVGTNMALSNEFYYLPTNLQLAKREDNTPKFLLVKYSTDARDTAGGTQGALLHFMMQWGLNVGQLAEAQTLLVKALQGKINSPTIKGPVEMEAAVTNSLSIVSASLSDAKYATIMTSGTAPVRPGQEIAVSSKMDKYAAQLLVATLEKTKSIADLSVKIDMKYKLLAPSVRGKITFDWEKLQTMSKVLKDSANVKRKSSFGLSSWGPIIYASKTTSSTVTRTQLDDLKKELIESKVVKVEIESYQENSEIANQLITHFTEMFMSSITEQAPAPIEQLPTATEEPINDSEIRYSFSVNKTKLEHNFSKKTETFDLSLRQTISYPLQMVGNFADWYNGVRDNKACVTSVNLSDPFFQHRDIRFILDIEAEQMFGQEVNYVTVGVRKTRASGQPFSDDITIDREYLKKTGTQASITYARNDDNNTDLYEYKTQWSLKGNILYPTNPTWQRGEWQGVTLGAPVIPKAIEFEGDLQQLKEMEIARATLIVRYMKFGVETESEIPLTVSAGEALVKRTFLMDRNQQGYAYRMVFTHKHDGKLALDWDSKINDGYVFANIPESFKDKASSIFKKALEAGKAISTGTSLEKKVEKGSEVLDKFKDIVKIIINK